MHRSFQDCFSSTLDYQPQTLIHGHCMNITIENIILIGSVLLLISILAGKTTYRFGIPTLLLFLTIGMLAGSDGIVGIYFDNPKIAQFVGVVSLNFILFSGGLEPAGGWQALGIRLRSGVLHVGDWPGLSGDLR